MVDDITSKNSIIRDLEALEYLIGKHLNEFCQDYASLGKAKNECQFDRSETEWGYNCENVQFRIDEKMGGTIPHNIEETFIELTVNLTGDLDMLDKPQDPLISYQLNINIRGKSLSLGGDDFVEYASSWHLDKHIREDIDNKPKYNHPDYHFQFGGNNMEEMDCGKAFILPTPRLPYPPLDIVLGVHFVLTNYYSDNKITSILEDSEYCEIVKNSQYRLWKPFYQAISNFWIPNNSNQWNPIASHLY